MASTPVTVDSVPAWLYVQLAVAFTVLVTALDAFFI